VESRVVVHCSGLRMIADAIVKLVYTPYGAAWNDLLDSRSVGWFIHDDGSQTRFHRSSGGIHRIYCSRRKLSSTAAVVNRTDHPDDGCWTQTESVYLRKTQAYRRTIVHQSCSLYNNNHIMKHILAVTKTTFSLGNIRNIRRKKKGKSVTIRRKGGRI